MFFIYKYLTLILYPILILYIFLRKLKKKEHLERYKEKIFSNCFSENRKKFSKLIWFHAASVGEMKSIIPIINELNKKYPNFEFLITTITLSSGNLFYDEMKTFKNIHHRYLPLDINFLIKKFISVWKPNMVFLVDSEIWPNLIFELKKNKIPLALINARITKKSFKKWKLVKNFAKETFSKFDLCLSSSMETTEYLKELEVKRIINNGNIKFINKIVTEDISNINKEFLEKNRFWFAASTHNKEEIECLKVHMKLKLKYDQLITIIAPRHINRAKNILKICNKLNLSSQILKKDEKISNNKEILIINSYGLLNEYFKYAKSVFIGKSLLSNLKDVGGQNPIDAAKLGCKIYHGPYINNFKEIYDILEKNKISFKVDNADKLASNLNSDLEDPKKNFNKFTNILNDLERKIHHDTMKNINSFLTNEII